MTVTAAEQLSNLQQQQAHLNGQVVATTRQLKVSSESLDAVCNAIAGIEIGLALAAEQRAAEPVVEPEVGPVVKTPKPRKVAVIDV